MRHLSLILLCLASVCSLAQETTYKNLKVLPKDITKQQLTTVMKTWTADLGVRCNFCHVGEPGAPLSSYDFASDEKGHKEIARAMVTMTRAINGDHLSKIDEDSRIDCRTCHRGVAHPRTLAQMMDINLNRKGLDGAVKRYASLREQYYGSDAYDFSEDSLNSYAQSLAKRGKTDEALRFLNLNLEHYPQSAEAHFLMGDILADTGKTDEARTHLQKALELNPELVPAKERLDALK